MAGELGLATRGLALVRKNAGGIGVELLVNFILPYVIYDLAKANFGDVRALIASSAPPILWSLITFARKREVDFISAFVLAGIALSLLAMMGGGGVKFLQLREKLVTAIIGVLFLASALIRRPLIYEFARASMKRKQSAALVEFEARKDDPRLRRTMMVVTVVWGLGLIGDAAASGGLVMVLSVKQYLIVGPIVGYGVAGALTLWTFLYMREKRRLGDERRAREAAEALDSQATLMSD